MLISFQAMPAWALVLVLCLLTVALTTFTSNVAPATIFMPILAALLSSVFFLCAKQILRCGLLITLPVNDDDDDDDDDHDADDDDDDDADDDDADDDDADD